MQGDYYSQNDPSAAGAAQPVSAGQTDEQPAELVSHTSSPSLASKFKSMLPKLAK